MISRSASLVLALPGLLAAQAAVDYALGTARSATGAAAQKTQKSIGATFDKLGRALQVQSPEKPKTAKHRGGSMPARATSASTSPAPASPQPPPEHFENPAGIQEGMASAEVLRRFGPPAMTLTTGPGEETLCYSAMDQNVDVQIRAGKVAAVKKTAASGQGAPSVRQPG